MRLRPQTYLVPVYTERYKTTLIQRGHLRITKTFSQHMKFSSSILQIFQGAPRPAGAHPHRAAAHAEPLPWCAQALAILTYLFGEWFSSSFVNQFVVCVLLLAFDFWTVKNVSGRLMVGLRWWSEVQDDGSQHWRFEAQEVRLRPRLPWPLPLSVAGRQRCAQPHPRRLRAHRRICRARRSTSASFGSA